MTTYAITFCPGDTGLVNKFLDGVDIGVTPAW